MLTSFLLSFSINPVPLATPAPQVAETTPPSPAPTTCTCRADGSFENNVLTLNFDYCGATPLTADWVGIYPCNADTIVATTEWWQTQVDGTGYIGDKAAVMEDYGFVEGQTYVLSQQLWWSYTCGSPIEGKPSCQNNTLSEPKGEVVIDPNVAPDWPFWGPSMGGKLAPGCYKVMLNRESRYSISPPPLPTVCSGNAWDEAFSFVV